MKKYGFLAAALLAGMLAACSPADQPAAEGTRSMYYLNNDQNRLEAVSYVPESTETVPMIDELIARQGSGTEDGRLTSLLPQDVSITGSVLDGTTLILDFSPEYSDMLIGREALVRGGLVREFLQVDGVERLMFKVDGTALTDSAGNEIGAMTADSFVENSASTINAYQSADMTLYFTNTAGSALIQETRKVYYIGSEPLERAVVEEVFRGPRMSGSSPVFRNEYKILSVITQDNMCYVNLDSASSGLPSVQNVREEVQIAALVNSLVDTCGVEQVQITLNGESDCVFRDEVSLSKPFQKDESLIQ